jgi:hypothetical protein
VGSRVHAVASEDEPFHRVGVREHDPVR